MGGRTEASLCTGSLVQTSQLSNRPDVGHVEDQGTRYSVILLFPFSTVGWGVGQRKGKDSVDETTGTSTYLRRSCP